MKNLINEMTSIKSLDRLFRHYTSDILEEMLSIYEFKCYWENYINFDKKIYTQLWKMYLSKISHKSQFLLLEIALKHYSEDIRKDLDLINSLAIYNENLFDNLKN